MFGKLFFCVLVVCSILTGQTGVPACAATGASVVLRPNSAILSACFLSLGPRYGSSVIWTAEARSNAATARNATRALEDGADYMECTNGPRLAFAAVRHAFSIPCAPPRCRPRPCPELSPCSGGMDAGILLASPRDGPYPPVAG